MLLYLKSRWLIVSIKNDVLALLSQNQNQYISGSSLAKSLNVSRNSIWKVIKSLENDGYKINAITNKGYALLSENDILSKEGIYSYLKDKDFFDIDCHSEVTSTSTILKDFANNGQKEGKVIVSAKQNAGRGRLGRDFYSPQDTGVYFSILLRPKISTGKTIFLTTMTAIAVVDAIAKVTNKESKIKWVNDIFVNDKKICGILSEASFTMENFNIDYVTLGIGINIYNPHNGFPTGIQDIAGYLLDDTIDDIRNRLVAQVLDNFLQYYTTFDTQEIAQKYKSYSYVLGKDILVIKNEQSRKAKVLDIDENCALVVRYEDNSIESLFSGEISTKILK